MSQTNAMSAPNAVPNGLPSHINGAGVDSSQSSRNSSPLTAPSTLRSHIPSSQLPPSVRAPIPSAQLPPSKPNILSPTDAQVIQLTQNYGNLQINRMNTPQSSPKMSTSTPDVKTSNVETFDASNFNHSNIMSPITGFTHSTTSHFSNVPLVKPAGVNGNHTNGGNVEVPSLQAVAVPSNPPQLPHQNSLPMSTGTSITRPPLQPSMSQPAFNLNPPLSSGSQLRTNSQVPSTLENTQLNPSLTTSATAQNYFQQNAPTSNNASGTNTPTLRQEQVAANQKLQGQYGTLPPVGQQQIEPLTQSHQQQTSYLNSQSQQPQSHQSSFLPQQQHVFHPPRQQSFPSSKQSFPPTSQQPRLPLTSQHSMPPRQQSFPPVAQQLPPNLTQQRPIPLQQSQFAANQPQIRPAYTQPPTSTYPQQSTTYPYSQPQQTFPLQQPPASTQQSISQLPFPTNQQQQFPSTHQQFPSTQQQFLPTQQPTSQQQQQPQQTNQPGYHQTNQQRLGRYPQMPQASQQQQQQKPYSTNQMPTNMQQSAYTGNQQSVLTTGFSKIWGGAENVDLLQMPNILPLHTLETPKVSLGNENLDAANCSSDVFRSTMTKIPESTSLLQKSRLPLGILIHPFKDLGNLAVVQCSTIVRCRTCRTYINPFVFFVDNKRWKCNLCYRVNELPEEFQYDPITKTYGDPSRRPEVRSSTIEYIAPQEYMLRPPQPAVYLFLLDISRAAIESGYLHTFCNVLSAELKSLPGDKRTNVGFIAYDSALHFFSLAEGLSQPHEMTVMDIDDVFLPCPDNLLVNLNDRMELIIDLLTQLPNRYNTSYDTGSALGSALQAAHKLMHVTGGRVTVFQSSLPTLGPGALLSREDPNKRSSAEAQHLNPANDFYKRLALDCSGQQIAVDLFIMNSQYVDLATISGISRFSGGCMHHFPLFKSSRQVQNEGFERCLRRYLTRKIGFEAVMRVRCTRGLSIHSFHGNFFVRSTDLLSLPNINPDAGFGMQIAIEESLSDVQAVCFQAALLFTSSKGERRIRVHTLCLPVTNSLTEIINSADQQCIIGLLSKMAVDRSMQSNLSDAREAFINVAIDILSSYKLAQNLGSGMSGLIAPSCLKLLPLYISALLKSTAFRTGISTRLDDRVKAMCDMKTKPLRFLIMQIYPDLYPVHKLMEEATTTNADGVIVPVPPHLQLTARSIDSNGAYLLDTGEHMVIYVGLAVSFDFLNQALGVDSCQSISEQMYELPTLENEFNRRLLAFVDTLNDDRPYAATIQVIRDNSPMRTILLERLIEDRLESALSYHEFLQHLKTQVK